VLKVGLEFVVLHYLLSQLLVILHIGGHSLFQNNSYLLLLFGGVLLTGLSYKPDIFCSNYLS